MKLNTNVIRTFLFVVFVLIVVQTVHKTYLIKKNVKEQFQNGLGTTTAAAELIFETNPVALRTTAASATNAADEESQLIQLRKQYKAEIGDMKTQIKTLENNINKTYKSSQAVKNSIDESLDEAKEASNEFKQNLNAFGEFHDNYSQELQRVLQKRLDYTDPAFKSRQEIQNNQFRFFVSGGGRCGGGRCGGF